ncbi:MAG: protein kinase [Planctomycetota bacterium]|nr:protein kinase [Planctomycetota bacterium]
MTNTTCFSRDELRSYLLGELSEPASGGVALHVETCMDCEATVVALDLESDTLIESLRQPVVPDEPASAYRLAAKRAISHWQESITDSTDKGTGQQATDAPRLRDYELLEPLARGGMGTVYRARHLRLNRQVALKVLPGRLLQDPAVVARFEREMHAVGSLRHPAIVQATDGGEAEGVHFLVMELIDGCDASGLVQLLGPLPVADACEIARQAAVGMAYVHGQGIIHRDLKPSNLMVTRAGDVKVLDLGLARVVGEQLAEDELTTIGQLMGTLDFMAPEQIENSHEVDERADIYSLGATLYKLLTGRAPHTTGSGEPLLSKLRRIASDPPMPLHERAPDVPAELCELVDRMLSIHTDDRPASMDSIADSLREFCTASDLAKRVEEAVSRRGKLKRSSDAPTPGSKSPWEAKGVRPQDGDARSAGGRRLLTWATAGLLLLAVAMGVVITLQTTAGQLVIETSTPDVEVRVLKAGQPYRNLTLKQTAESLRLGAGEYEIEIISGADGLEIENGSYTLKRGETWLARIVHRETITDEKRASPSGEMYGGMESMDGGAMPPASREPTYEGKTLGQWLALLRRERSAKQLVEACRALDKLGLGDDTEEAVAALLVAMRVQHSNENYESETGESIRLWDTVHVLLAGREQTAVVTALTNELAHRDEANAEFILNYLLLTNQRVRPFATGQLLAHIERLATDEESNVRTQALGVLRALGSEETATRRLVAALSDRDGEVQLFAARTLIEMQSNVPLVVSTLRQIVVAGELRHRAEAAWRLGDLGVAAKPALPELTAIVQDEDDAISRAAAYPTPGFAYGGGFGGGMTSVKDAAIRALAEIGDESVVPVLIAEWERRALGDGSPNKPTPAWNEVTFPTVANTYNAEWVADAIEKLIGMRPRFDNQGEGDATTWRIRNLSLNAAYQAAFSNSSKSSLPYAWDAAKKLLPRARAFEKVKARQYIAGSPSGPRGPDEIELEVKLIELLATSDDPQHVLESMFNRWMYFASLGSNDWKPEEQAAALDAYRDCAVRIVRGTDDWMTTLVPHYIRSTDRRRWPEGVVLMELLPELDPESQLASVVCAFQLIANSGKRNFATSLEHMTEWMADPSHRDAIHRQLEQASGSDWEDLVVGMLRSGLADDVVKQTLKTRFGDDSIRRSDMLEKLIISLDDQPKLAQVVIDLIQHPALDAITVIVREDGRYAKSFRALDLQGLTAVQAQHRPNFMPLLQKLLQSDKDGESEAARSVLELWK